MTELSSMHYPSSSSEQLNKRFYHQFKSEHAYAVRQLRGAPDEAEGHTYITTLLLRLMVLFFLQAQGFLDHDQRYLLHYLQLAQQRSGSDCFFREYLLPLFTTLYTGQPTTAHHSSGHLPRVEIPLFLPEALELRSPHLKLSDATFFRLFTFLHTYQWKLDDQSEPENNALRPSILAFIFEHHCDQKLTGTYYTQDDIAFYITSNTILPRLFTLVAEDQPEDLGEQAPCWQLLSEQPDRYIPMAIQTTSYLPEETEREYAYRQQRYRALLSKLRTGSIHDIVDLTTNGLDLQRFLIDILSRSQKLTFLQAFLRRLQRLTVLDPTCGSGAFLLAATRLLYPLYTCCLEQIDLLASTSQVLCGDDTSQQFAEVTSGTEAPQAATVGCVLPRPAAIMRTILSFNLYGVELLPAASEICRLRLYLALLASISQIENVPPMSALRLHIRTGNALVGEIRRTGPIPPQGSAPTLHHPPAFHWHFEFPQVFSRGGFDVIIGNPPYLEHSKIRHEYAVHGYEETSCGNIYAAVIERSLALCKPGQGRLGFIVPISLCGAQRFVALRQSLLSISTTLWLANFEIFPCRLFEGAFQRLSILLLHVQNSSRVASVSTLYVTRIHRWYSAERPYLLALLMYTSVPSMPTDWPLVFPKLAATQQAHLLNQLRQQTRGMDIGKSITERPSDHFIYYQEATNYWTKAVCHIPFYKKNGVVMIPPHGRLLYFARRNTALNVMAVLNSSLFYVWFATYSDGFHLSDTLVKHFPLSQEVLESTELAEMAEQLEAEILRNARLSTRNTRRKQGTGHQIELAEYYMRFSKPLLDEIDRLLARHFQLTPENLDFILHYDEKHRIARQGKR
ncbi:Eco57I restriction-modification methylase domain-containing protein [Dictyobacter aurantiacus]|uniref:site-specific DNA-methyltransferase (adenine-specific) n=1 Tax=Dictyobacter aurantiacus TaxID=1936993 RepID=A0A401Z814_9CHLR|nr:DNA methyltransferase [Dictyobacter aurantiacus]GCE03007.1 hypothetical protein KDAU_03360 [Dictyobacter aurantiacus]